MPLSCSLIAVTQPVQWFEGLSSVSNANIYMRVYTYICINVDIYVYASVCKRALSASVKNTNIHRSTCPHAFTHTYIHTLKGEFL